MNGALRLASAKRSSTCQASSAVAATTCWASTSRGLVGTRSDSIAPVRIRSTATAVWARSPRCLGKSTPRETSPTWWPARPTRWSALATLGGDSIWTTRSTAPMSMPSSRLLVATTQGSRPRLRSSSISARCSLDTEPWWALAIDLLGRRRRRLARTGPSPAAGGRRCVVEASPTSPPARSVAISLSRAVSRSASRRELAKTIVERCCLDQVDDALLDVRPDALRALRVPLAVRSSYVVVGRGHVLDRDDDLEVPLLLGRRRDDLDRRACRRGSGRPPPAAGRSRTARCAGPAGRAARRVARG